MGIFSDLFKKQKCLFIGDEINENRPQSCLSTLPDLKKIAKTEEIEVLLCESSGSAGHFLVGTQTDLIYVYAHNTFYHTMSRYPYETITGIMLQSNGALKYVTLGLNGAFNKMTDVYCDNEDFTAFYNVIMGLIRKNKERNILRSTNNITIADELLKYKQLLDSGAISAEEYQFLKAKLIKQSNNSYETITKQQAVEVKAEDIYKQKNDSKKGNTDLDFDWDKGIF